MKSKITARSLVRLVEVAVVFEDGVAAIFPVEWRKGMTVLDALKRLAEMPHGKCFRISGEGPSAFVTEIDGEANDPSGNWMYSVNGEMPSVGCGQRALSPSDRVRWEFVPFDPNLT
jgi:hypothetical protein